MGSMNLVLPEVGITPGPAWGTLLNTALSPNIEEHDHSPGSGVYVKTSGNIGIDVNGDLSFKKIGAATYSSATDVKSIEFIGAPVYPVAGNLNLYTNATDLFFRDGSGTEIQITDGGGIPSGRQYGFQGGYDSLTPNSGWANYNVGFKNYNFASDNTGAGDTLLLANGVCQSSDVAWSWSSTVLGLGVEAPTLSGSVRIGYMPELAAPDPALYTYPGLWVAEIVPQGASSTQNGLRIQGDLMAAPAANDGPGHLDLTAYALNPALSSYWKGLTGTTTPQISTGDGVIAYRGNPNGLATTTDLFISGSYDVRNFWFYDGIKLPGDGGIELHVNGGDPISPSQVDIIPKPSTDVILNLHDRTSNKVLDFNGGDARLWRFPGTNGEFQIKQAGTGNMTLRTGATSAIGVQIDDTQTVTLGNSTTTPVNTIGNLRVGYQSANYTPTVDLGYDRGGGTGGGALRVFCQAAAPTTHSAQFKRYGNSTTVLNDGNLVIDNTGTGKFQLTNAGAGSFEVSVNGGIGLAINNTQTTTCYGDLYVNGGTLSNKIIVGNGSAVACGLELGLARTGNESSFIDFTTETTTGDFDARLQRIHDSGASTPGVLKLQNNGDKNILLRVGDPAAAVQTQRESFAGAGIKTGAIGFDNEEIDPRELTSEAGFGSDPNIQCYDNSRAILNMQSIIMARARVLWDPLGGTYSVGTNRWNFDSTVTQDGTGELRMSLLIPPKTNTAAPGTGYGNYDACYFITTEQMAAGGDPFIASARQGSGSTEVVEISLMQASGAKIDTNFSIMVVGFPTVVP